MMPLTHKLLYTAFLIPIIFCTLWPSWGRKSRTEYFTRLTVFNVAVQTTYWMYMV
jgi:hypothetical protein